MNHTLSRSLKARVSLTACAVAMSAAVAIAQSTTSGSATAGSSSSRDDSSHTQSGSYGTQSGSSGSQSGSYGSQGSTGSSQDTTTGASSYGSGGSTSTTGSAGSTGTTYGSGTSETSTTGSPGSTGATYGSRPSTTGSATTMTGRTSDKLSWGDRRFVNKAADSSATEVQLAKLAQQQASSSEVKNFAQELVKSHTNVNSELMRLASMKNVDIDKEDLGKARVVRRMSDKRGTEFDQEFIEEMVDMHESDVKLFEKAARDAKDPELRSFAAKNVEHLRQHLQRAQNLRATVMPTGRTDDDTSRATPGPSSGMGTSSTSGSSTSQPGSWSGSSSSETAPGSSTSGSSGASDRETGGSGSTDGSSRDPRY